MTMMTETTESHAGNGNGALARLAESMPVQVQASRIDVEFENLLDPTKFTHLQRVANLFASSELVPQHFRGNVSNCFIALQMSLRMRVDPFMFMQNTYIVYGRPGMEAKLAIALINSAGIFGDSLDYEIEGGTDPKSTNYRVRAFATRKSTGKVVHGPWVDWQVVRSEGWDKKQGSKWLTIPGLMFQYRAATFFGRLHCPERLMGMQTVDELRDSGEFPTDRTVISAGAASKTDSLLSKLTNKPLSEGQTLEPDANYVNTQSQIASDAAATEANDELRERFADTRAPEPEVGQAQEDAEGMTADDKQWVADTEAMNHPDSAAKVIAGYAADAGHKLTDKQFDKFLAAYATKAGAKSWAETTERMRIQLLDAAVDDKVNYTTGAIAPQ